MKKLFSIMVSGERLDGGNCLILAETKEEAILILEKELNDFIEDKDNTIYNKEDFSIDYDAVEEVDISQSKAIYLDFGLWTE